MLITKKKEKKKKKIKEKKKIKKKKINKSQCYSYLYIFSILQYIPQKHVYWIIVYNEFLNSTGFPLYGFLCKVAS